MLEDPYPLRWTGRQAVVTLPEHIDVSNVGQIREELLWAINRGASALIADLTATVSCDHAGAEALARAHRRAAASGTEFRLVVTAQVVARALSLNGLDRLVSIYPSLEAALAARAPAPGQVPASGPAATETNGRAPSRYGERTRAQFPADGLPDGNRAVPRAVAWKIIDALQDGVVLTDGDGAVALANRRLEQMFGYEHGELIGRAIGSLMPVSPQAAHRSHGATCARGPRAQPIGAAARLPALRKDGTTFPVEISISPVTTAAGPYTLAVIRDITESRQLEDLADLVSAVLAGRGHRGRELLDSVSSSLFQVGLSLQGALELPAEMTRQHITEALSHLDETVRQIRDTALTIRDDEASAQPAPFNGLRRPATLTSLTSLGSSLTAVALRSSARCWWSGARRGSPR